MRTFTKRSVATHWYVVFSILLMAALFIQCGSEARSSLKCPKPCTKNCKFKATLSGKKDFRACEGTGGFTNVEVKLFKFNPKKDGCCIADVDREPFKGDGHISWTLCDGTKCKMTADNFAEGSPYPLGPNSVVPEGKRALSKKCFESFTTNWGENGGGFTWKEVKGIQVDYDIVTFCTCCENVNEGTIGFKDELKW